MVGEADEGCFALRGSSSAWFSLILFGLDGLETHVMAAVSDAGTEMALERTSNATFVPLAYRRTGHDKLCRRYLRMVVHVSDITSGEPEAIAATLKRAAKGRASLFLVVCIEDAPGDGARPDSLAAIVDEARRRTNGKAPAGAHLYVGDLHMDRDRCEVTRARRPIQLSPMEYTLLEFFMLHHDCAVSEDQIMRSVFRSAAKAGRFNTLWVHIHRLRKKIDRPPDPPLIHTIKGRGYILKSPPPKEPVAAQA